jgi:hypothetical protein
LGCGLGFGFRFGIGFRFGYAQGVDIHFGGAEAVETPCVPGDGMGEFVLFEGLGVEGGDVFGLERFEDGAVFGGEGDDLSGEVVADGVEAGFFFAFERARAAAFESVEAVGRELLLGDRAFGIRGRCVRRRYHDLLP